MPKDRVPIPEEVAAAVLFEADRTCCVCNTRGLPVQLHHIDEDPSHNDPGNLAVVCLHCHDDTQLKGGFGRKLDAAQIRRYKSNWKERVGKRRADADKLAAEVSAMSEPTPTPATSPGFSFPDIPPRDGLVPFVESLPDLRRAAYSAARDGWDSGVTARMVEASYSIIEVLETALMRLARYYPHGHFDVEDPRIYFSEVIATRFRWHHYHNSTSGMGFSGTMVATMTALYVVSDVESMISDMVFSLLPTLEGPFQSERWRVRWQEQLL